MMSKKKSKQKTKESMLNNFARRNKTVLFIAFFFAFLAISVLAATTITDTNVDSPTGTYTNLSADSINSVLYVDAGNGSDIQVKIDLSAGGQEVRITEPGTYNLDSTLSTTNGDILIMSEGVILNVTGDFNGINLSTTGNVHISGGRINVPTDTYTHSAIYLNPSTDISSTNPIIIEDINLYQTGDGSGNGIFIDTPDNGDSLTWARFENLVIDNFNTSIRLESTAGDGNSYINANWFNNIVGKGGAYMYYVSVTGGNEISGNSFNKNQMQSNADAIAMISAAGIFQQNYIEAFMWDIVGSAEYINLDASATSNYIVGRFEVGKFTDLGFNTKVDYYSNYIYGIDRIYGDDNIDDFIQMGSHEIIYSGVTGSENKIRLQKNGSVSNDNVHWYLSDRSNGQDFWIYSFNGSDYWNPIMIDYSEKEINIRDTLKITDKLTFALGEIIDNLVDGWLRITGSLEVTGDLNVTGTATITNVTVGDGISQHNITMTSPDGTEYSCGVADGGAFTCS